MPLRTMTYNVLECTGFWSRDGEERRARAFTPEEATARFAGALGAHGPDIVTLCEAPAPTLVEAIASRLGMHCVAFPSPQRWPGALLTTAEVLEATPLTSVDPELHTRHAGRALLRHAREGMLAVYSVHLHPSDSQVRTREQARILDLVRADIEAGHGVLVQGDLNHRPEMPEYAGWLAAGLEDLALASTALNDEALYTFRSDLRMARLDYVWAGGSLAGRSGSARVLDGAPFSFGLGADPPLSDHLPVLAEFA